MEQGLIQGAQSPDNADSITPEKIAEGIQIPDDLKEAYERVVASGMQVLFSKDTHQAALDIFKTQQGDVAQKLGQGIAGLLATIYGEAGGSLPPQVMIPAGVELLVQAADFMRRSGMAKITNKVIGDAMDIMVTSILEGAGLSIDKMVGFVDQKMASGEQPPAAEEPEQPPTEA
jgi:hypothetical protein